MLRNAEFGELRGVFWLKLHFSMASEVIVCVRMHVCMAEYVYISLYVYIYIYTYIQGERERFIYIYTYVYMYS